MHLFSTRLSARAGFSLLNGWRHYSDHLLSPTVTRNQRLEHRSNVNSTSLVPSLQWLPGSLGTPDTSLYMHGVFMTCVCKVHHPLLVYHPTPARSFIQRYQHPLAVRTSALVLSPFIDNLAPRLSEYNQISSGILRRIPCTHFRWTYWTPLCTKSSRNS